MATNTNPLVYLIGFCLHEAEQKAVATRIEIYRSLASTCGDEKEARELRQLALELEMHEEHFRDFMHRFSQKNKVKGATK